MSYNRPPWLWSCPVDDSKRCAGSPELGPHASSSQRWNVASPQPANHPTKASAAMTMPGPLFRVWSQPIWEHADTFVPRTLRHRHRHATVANTRDPFVPLGWLVSVVSTARVGRLLSTRNCHLPCSTSRIPTSTKPAIQIASTPGWQGRYTTR